MDSSLSLNVSACFFRRPGLLSRSEAPESEATSGWLWALPKLADASSSDDLEAVSDILVYLSGLIWSTSLIVENIPWTASPRHRLFEMQTPALI